jgi:hypothetical protein
MPRTTFEPMRVFFLDTVSDLDGPTVAEITAGTELTSQLTVDGVGFSGNRNNASQAMLGDAYVAEEPGTWNVAGSLTFVRDDSGSLAYDTFDYRTRGFLVFLNYGGEVEDGNLVDVYAVASHKPTPMASAENEYQKVEVQFAVSEAPHFDVPIGGES